MAEPADQQEAEHPTLALDDLVHQRTRLGILTVLSEAGQSDFSYLRSRLQLTDGNLSRHLQVLERAHLVEIRKTFEKRRPRTWINISDQGGKALEMQLASMRALLQRLES